MSWPEALKLLSAELGEPVTFRVAAERQFLERLTGAEVGTTIPEPGDKRDSRGAPVETCVRLRAGLQGGREYVTPYVRFQ